MKIALSRITPDPGQPRKLFDAADLQDLANSIAEKGLLQPITVRPRDKAGHFFIIAGERRYRATCMLRDRGLKQFQEIEANVRETASTVELRVLQAVENIQRADITPLEEAASYAELVALGLSEGDAAKQIGIPVTRFRQRVSLLNLDESVSKLLAAKQLEAPQAYELARLPNRADQTKLLRMINRGEIGKWKSLKAAVDALLEGEAQNDMFGPGAPAANAEDVAAVNAMERRIESLAAKLATGWHSGECIIANKVSPDRAARMADQLAAIRATVRTMEQQLRNVTAQARIALEA